MTKKRVCIIAIICIILLAMSILLIPWLNNYVEYFKNKKKVLDYVDACYDIEYKVVYTRVGKDAWPAERQADVFIIKDLTNDIYFEIDYGHGVLHDKYSYAFEGKKVSDAVKAKFPQTDFEYHIRCYGEKSQYEEKPYQIMWCRIFFMAENAEDLSDAYKITSFLKDNFPGLELELRVVPYSAENKVVNLLEYKKEVSIEEMKCFYDKTLEMENSLFSSMEEFRQLLEE